MGLSYIPQPSADVITLLDEQGTTTYVGKASPNSPTSEPVWQIRRIVSGVGTLEVKFADGDTRFDNVWDARAALGYT